MPTSANCPKNPSDVRADVGIRAPILPLSQQPLADAPTDRRWLRASDFGFHSAFGIRICTVACFTETLDL